jgi:hypothetical protein
MCQESVLIWFHSQYLINPLRKFRTKEILEEYKLVHPEDNDIATQHSLKRLCFWSFIKRDITITGYKDRYSITPTGIKTAELWIDLNNKQKTIKEQINK